METTIIIIPKGAHAPEHEDLGGDAIIVLNLADILDLVDKATVAMFQNIAGTGTATNPDRVNDDNVGLSAQFTINQYAEVDFGRFVGISQWRIYGHASHNGDGAWSLQYWDGTAFVNWETGIATRVTADWSNLASPAAGRIFTDRIRIVCTTADTAPGNYCPQLELVN